MLERDALLAELSRILADDFEIDEALITPQAHLYQDLDLDSIDAVDLMIKLQQLTGQKLKPEEFKAVRTIDDVVIALQRLITNG